MKPTLLPGLKSEVQHRVVTQELLSTVYPGGPPVFATPFLLSLMEHAAARAVQPHLDEGEASVGCGSVGGLACPGGSRIDGGASPSTLRRLLGVQPSAAGRPSAFAPIPNSRVVSNVAPLDVDGPPLRLGNDPIRSDDCRGRI